jgi:hypothetical protein
MFRKIFLTAAVLAMTSTAGAQQAQYTPDGTTTSGTITMGIGSWNAPAAQQRPQIPAHQLKHYLTGVYVKTWPGVNGVPQIFNCRAYHDTWHNARAEECWEAH